MSAIVFFPKRSSFFLLHSLAEEKNMSKINSEALRSAITDILTGARKRKREFIESIDLRVRVPGHPSYSSPIGQLEYLKCGSGA